jgi:AcrR family transcriptional regulator
MTDRKKQILQTAIEIIAIQGYGNLTMRALARASDLKLGALQYHFPTSEDMLRAMVEYVSDTYASSFEALRSSKGSLGIRDIVLFMFDDEAGKPLMGDRLWPQLWAMQQIEPLVSDMVDDIFAQGIKTLEGALEHAGVSAPRGEALCLMSLIEGSTIFIGHGRRWVRNKKILRDTLLQLVDDRYGESLMQSARIKRVGHQ